MSRVTSGHFLPVLIGVQVRSVLGRNLERFPLMTALKLNGNNDRSVSCLLEPKGRIVRHTLDLFVGSQ